MMISKTLFVSLSFTWSNRTPDKFSFISHFLVYHRERAREIVGLMAAPSVLETASAVYFILQLLQFNKQPIWRSPQSRCRHFLLQGIGKPEMRGPMSTINQIRVRQFRVFFFAKATYSELGTISLLSVCSNKKTSFIFSLNAMFLAPIALYIFCFPSISFRILIVYFYRNDNNNKRHGAAHFGLYIYLLSLEKFDFFIFFKFSLSTYML